MPKINFTVQVKPEPEAGIRGYEEYLEVTTSDINLEDEKGIDYTEFVEGLAQFLKDYYDTPHVFIGEDPRF